MKLPLIVLFLFSFSLFSFAQINSSLDFVGGVDYSYRDMKVNKNSSFSDTLIARSFNERETGRINFRFGFNFNKKVSKKIFFKMGLRFTSVGYQDKENTELRWPSEQIGGVFTPDIPSEEPDNFLKTKYNYLFIEVPLVARFEFSQKKFTPFVEIGASPSLFLKTRNKFISNDRTEIADVDHSNYSKLHLVSVLSVGGNYSINESLQLFAQPTFRYHLTRLFKTGSVKEHLWNVGLEFGLRKRLN